MSSPNPLVPQGSLLEQQAKSKSTFHVAALMVGLHVFLLGGLLIIGCKREEPKVPENTGLTDALTPVVTDTNIVTDPSFAAGTNVAPTNVIPPVSFAPPPVTTPTPVPLHPTYEPPQPAVHETAAPGGTTEYVVKKGDIAGRIATKNHVTLKQLQEANPGVDLAKIKVNQKLNVPAAAASVAPATHAATDLGNGGGAATETTVHVVKSGDNLTKLAKKYGTTIKAIRDANGLKSNSINVGQKLKIPAKAGAAPAPAPAEPTPAPAAPTLPVVTPVPAAGAGGTYPR